MINCPQTCISCNSNVSLTYHAQLPVQLVSYDWLEEALQMKAEWRSAWTTCGELCVMTPGETLMPLWCVDSWVTLLKVRRIYLSLGHSSPLPAPSCWIVMLVLGMRIVEKWVLCPSENVEQSSVYSLTSQLASITIWCSHCCDVIEQQVNNFRWEPVDLS